MTNAILREKPDAGNPHGAPTPDFGAASRADEGKVASAKPRCGLLYSKGVGHRISPLAAALFSFVFSLSAHAAAPTLASPANGAMVALQNVTQKAYFAMDRSERWAYMDSVDGRNEMIAATSRPEPVTFSWSGGTAPYTLTVKRVDDGATFALLNNISSTSVRLYNFEIGRTYSWTVKERNGAVSATRTFTTETDAPRFLRVGLADTDTFYASLVESSGEGSAMANGSDFLPNFRDLGGVFTADRTQRMKQGLVFRSYEFDKCGDEWKPYGVDTDLVCGIGPGQFAIKTDIDLRSDLEVAAVISSNNGKSPLNTMALPVAWQHCAIAQYDAEQLGTAERNALALVADASKYPLVFHGMRGQDRTGCLAIYIYSILGVDDETMLKCWEASSFFQGDNNRSETDPGFRSYRIQGFIDSFRTYGTSSDTLGACVVKALKAKNVVTEETISQIRANLLETDEFCDKKGFERAKAENRPPRILVIGNSFTQSVSRDLQYNGKTIKEYRTHFPTAVRAMGETIDYCALYRGGSSIQQHYEHRETKGFFAEIDWSFDSAAPSWARNGEKKGMFWCDEDGKTKDNRESETELSDTTPFHICLDDLLNAVDWDVIMIQESAEIAPFWNAPESEWIGVNTPECRRDYETGTPRVSYGEPLANYVAYLKAKRPNAELWFHQTWALPAETTCIDLGTKAKRDWMYNAINSNAVKVAELYGTKTLPTGYAVQLYRYQYSDSHNPEETDPCSYDLRHINGGYSIYAEKKIPEAQRYRTYLQMMTWCQRWYGKMPDIGTTPCEPSVSAELMAMRAAALQAATATEYWDYGQGGEEPAGEDPVVTIGDHPHLAAAWTSGDGSVTNAVEGTSFKVGEGTTNVKVIFTADPGWEIIGDAVVELGTVTEDIIFGEGNDYRVPEVRDTSDDIPYLDYDEATGTMTNAAVWAERCTVVTNGMRELADGWYAVTNEVVFASGARLTVQGDVYLILCDGATLAITNLSGFVAAVDVSGTHSLTIYGQTNGTGTLLAKAHGYGAGIGGGNNCDGGTVTINGGIVTAQGGMGAAGIGCGYPSATDCTVTIHGGTVTAIGGDFAAGIGGGYTKTWVGSVAITGGKVTAEGKDGASAIGPGEGGKGGDIAISGGLFWAEPPADWLARGCVAVENTDEATRNAYPYAVEDHRVWVSPDVPAGPYATETEATDALNRAVFAPSADVAGVLTAGSARTRYAGWFGLGITSKGATEWYVEAALTDAAKTNLAATATAATRQIPVADIAALEDDATTNVTVTGCEPGFYYTLHGGAVLTGIVPDAANRDVLCGVDGKVVFPTVAKPSDAAGFFRVGVDATK